MPHPAVITDLFRHVTTQIYAAIELFYCDRVGRSIATVHRIMAALAQAAGVEPLTYEAIWSICLYLRERRQEATLITRQRLTTDWQIVVLEPPLQVLNRAQVAYSPLLSCVIDSLTGNVESFRVACSEGVKKAIRLAIYDAIVANRLPSQIGACGLMWRLPATLVAPICVSTEVEQVATILALSNRPAQSLTTKLPTPLPTALQGDWTRDLRTRVIPQARFELLFDNYLFRCQSFGPRRRQTESRRTFAHLRGYSRDAGSLFPALRTLLPSHSGQIHDGVVLHAKLHYAHELLAHWPEHKVTIKCSQESEARCWIYLNNDILCEAYATELNHQ